MSKHAEEAAIKVAHGFIEAFNAQDHQALAATLNFPHVRLAKGAFATTDSAEDFIASRIDVAKGLRAEGWHHTVMTSMTVTHSGDDKVHLALSNDRCHADGSVYSKFDTLWIATRQDGHWGIQFRSSYLR